MSRQVDGGHLMILCESCAQAVEHAQVHAPTVQQHHRGGGVDAAALYIELAACERRDHAAPRSSHSAPKVSASASTSCSRCMADSVMRSRAVPAGTVGGRIAATQKPAFISATLNASAQADSPTISGCIGVLDAASGNP